MVGVRTAIASLLALLAPTGAMAATLDVCASGCAHSTIAGAAAAAASGDVIDVGSGTWLECGLAIGAGVSIQGAGRGLTMIDTRGCPNTAALTVGDGSSAQDLGLLPHGTSGDGLVFVGDGTAMRVDVRGGEVLASGGGAGDTIALTSVLLAGSLNTFKGVEAGNASWVLDRVTLVQAGAPNGYGADVGAQGDVTLVSSILTGWGQGVLVGTGSCSVRWTDVWDNGVDWDACTEPWGYGNFAFDPLFVAAAPTDPVVDDFHLQSSAGSWDGAGFSVIGGDSLAVDAAKPETVTIAAEADWACNTPNLGAYGGTAEASRSWWTVCPVEHVSAGQGFLTLEEAVDVNGSTGDVLALRGGPVDLNLLDTRVNFDWGATVQGAGPETVLMGEGARELFQTDPAGAQLVVGDLTFHAEERVLLWNSTSNAAFVDVIGTAETLVYRQYVSQFLCNDYTFSLTRGLIGTMARPLEQMISAYSGTNSDGGRAVSVTILDSSFLVDQSAYIGHIWQQPYTTGACWTTAPTLSLVMTGNSLTNLQSGGELRTVLNPSVDATTYLIDENSFEGVKLTLDVADDALSVTEIKNNLFLNPRLTNDVLNLVDGGGSTPPAQVHNNSFVGGRQSVDLGAVDADVRGNLITQATLAAIEGTGSATVQYNAFWDNASNGPFALDSTNITTCDPGFPSVSSYTSPAQFLTIPSCLVDMGDPSFGFNDGPGDPNDIGATGGPGGDALVSLFDTDGDGFVGTVDCDDTDPNVFPGAPDACDGVDSDCAGGDGPDDDGDGFEDANSGCAGATGTDCVDSDAGIHPGAVDPSCDGVDQDCDGADTLDFDGDGYLCDTDDCDDTDAAISPAASETCDGADTDCNGAIDDTVDADGDGVYACDDCDDADAANFPGNVEVCDGLDNDCDGLPENTAVDADGDGVLLCNGDCDDDDASIYPGNAESCDGIDNDCDASTEAGPGESDADGDGQMPCAGDCDDGDAANYDGNLEVCDGQDNDCDGAGNPSEVDGDGDGVMVCEGDCDDLAATTLPDAAELCDALDNDCDGSPGVDEVDGDGDGLMVCAGDCDDTDATCGASPDCDDADTDGFRVCDDDCDDTRATVNPAQAFDVCDGNDTDCDGVLPDDEQDPDEDGYLACDDWFGDEAPAGVLGGGDCAPDHAAVNPGQTEICDGLDTDCDGALLDGEADLDDDGFLPCADADCDDTEATTWVGAPERCDGEDNDCDGVVPTDEFDTDGDGFVGCEDDCGPEDDAVHPGATELCDGTDQDCDGDIVEGFGDVDEDGLPDCDGTPDGPAADAPGVALNCTAGGPGVPGRTVLLLLLTGAAGLRRSRPQSSAHRRREG